MPSYATSQEWLHQSSLLIEARPTTTRITTKYHITKSRRIKKGSSELSKSSTATAAPRASLTLKTYDPYSGACLKYRTTKAAEVSRLILSLGQPLGARMAALPLPEAADEIMTDVGATPAEEKGEGQTTAPAAASGSTSAGAKGESKGEAKTQGGSGAGGGGGKGKKKRGKK